LHHLKPIFEPISPPIVLVGAAGRRTWSAFEVVFAVALGIGAGDLLSVWEPSWWPRSAALASTG
jgi:hypothetical protein